MSTADLEVFVTPDLPRLLREHAALLVEVRWWEKQLREAKPKDFIASAMTLEWFQKHNVRLTNLLAEIDGGAP